MNENFQTINDKLPFYISTLRDSDSFPYNIDENIDDVSINYLSIRNKGTTELIVSITPRNTSLPTLGNLYIPANDTVNIITYVLSEIDIVQASDSFYILLCTRGDK